MSSSMNHRKRSHRSEKRHWVCLHSMRQFAPAGYLSMAEKFAREKGEQQVPGRGPRKLLAGNAVSRHLGGWLKSTKKRDRKRADVAREGVPA